MMLFAIHSQLVAEGIDIGLDASIAVSDFRGKCAANDLVALRLSAVSSKYPRDQLLSVGELGSPITFAQLLTCSGTPFTYGAASAALAAAYLADAEYPDAVSGTVVRRDYVFKYDYLVVGIPDHDDYNARFRAGSGIWGGFTHIEEQANRRAPYPTRVKPVICRPNLRVRDVQKDSIFRAIDQVSPLERYLKLYHLIEIVFDLEIVQQITALGPDLKGVGKLLNEYSGDKEFERLLKIIRKYCPDQAFHEEILGNAFADAAHHPQLMELLVDYSKESNPYRDKPSDFRAAITLGFSEANFKAKKLTWNLEQLSKLTAYIVYRFRCSIAHSRVGEHLFTASDEEFVAEVGEPLLLRVLLEVQKP